MYLVNRYANMIILSEYSEPPTVRLLEQRPNMIYSSTFYSDVLHLQTVTDCYIQ